MNQYLCYFYRNALFFCYCICIPKIRTKYQTMACGVITIFRGIAMWWCPSCTMWSFQPGTSPFTVLTLAYKKLAVDLPMTSAVTTIMDHTSMLHQRVELIKTLAEKLSFMKSITWRLLLLLGVLFNVSYMDHTTSAKTKQHLECNDQCNCSRHYIIIYDIIYILLPLRCFELFLHHTLHG